MLRLNWATMLILCVWVRFDRNNQLQVGFPKLYWGTKSVLSARDFHGNDL